MAEDRADGASSADATRVSHAVVIAAGAGRRLRDTSDEDAIKPITPVLGVPLVVRTLATLRDEGVREATVVTGYKAAEVEAVVGRSVSLAPLRLRFVRNADWRRQNGLSVLAARGSVGGAFLLSMADHLYAPALVRTLRAARRTAGELLLAIDRRTSEVPDPDDAMWVRLDARDRIHDIGKRLSTYDAVDTGVFLADAALFDALDVERQEHAGDCALADGVRRLARQGRARAVDIADAWWHDVDTRADLLRVEARLRAAGVPVTA